MERQILTQTAEETVTFARSVGESCSGGEVLLLIGELGSGKTRFTQGLALGLGVDEYVHSPTFTLVNQYHGRLPLYHVDLYRIDSQAEALDLGIGEYIYGDGVCVVEWADKALGVFPPEQLLIQFVDLGGTRRRLTLNALAASHERLLERALAGTRGSR